MERGERMERDGEQRERGKRGERDKRPERSRRGKEPSLIMGWVTWQWWGGGKPGCSQVTVGMESS